jgi:hypothetical protein
MNLREFAYQKEDGTRKDYTVLKVKEDATSIEGLSMRDLPEADKAKVIAIYEEFEAKLKPYMKNWRKFLKARMTEKKE